MREEEWINQLSTLEGNEVIPAISGVAAFGARKAVPALLKIAADRREKDNRDRWMAIRALGLIGDQGVVPDLIDLTYHYNQNVRFWAQISLVRITGQNFGRDAAAWKHWWNQQGGKPPAAEKPVAWATSPEALVWADPQKMDEVDRLFLQRATGSAKGGGTQRGPVPQIVATSPPIGATDVDPTTAEITVTFDRDMSGGYSWTGGGSDYPPTPEGKNASWRDPRTCVLPVKLEAGHYYRVGINSQSYKNFRSAEGAPVRPSALYFITKGASEEVRKRVEKPQIVSMSPPNGAKDVDPGLRELRVTFNVPMGGGISWTGDGPHYLKTVGRPHWTEDRRTCVLPVELKPGWEYRVGLNSASFNNFQSEAGIPLEPVEYTFTTRDQVVEGVGWGGFRVGATRDEQIKDFGPLEPTPTPGSKWTGWVSRHHINCWFDQAGRASEVRFNKGFALPLTSGIMIGSAEKDVLEAYGAPDRVVNKPTSKMLEYGKRGVLMWIIDGEVFDFTVFKPHRETPGTLIGIGAELEKEQDRIFVRRVIPGSSGQSAGLQPGDELREIDGQPVSADLEDIVMRVRGDADTIVKIKVRKQDGTEVELAIPRWPIVLSGAAADPKDQEAADRQSAGRATDSSVAPAAVQSILKTTRSRAEYSPPAKPAIEFPPENLKYAAAGSDDDAKTLLARVLNANRPWLEPSAVKATYSLLRQSAEAAESSGPFSIAEGCKRAVRVGSIVRTPLHNMPNGDDKHYTVRMVGKSQWKDKNFVAVDVTFDPPVRDAVGFGGQMGTSYSHSDYVASAARIMIEPAKAVPLFMESWSKEMPTQPPRRFHSVWVFDPEFFELDGGFAQRCWSGREEAPSPSVRNSRWLAECGSSSRATLGIPMRIVCAVPSTSRGSNSLTCKSPENRRIDCDRLQASSVASTVGVRLSLFSFILCPGRLSCGD